MEQKMDRFIKIGEVMEITGMSRSGVYRAMKHTEFPAQFKISTGGFSARWSLDEITAWMDAVKENR